MHRIFSSLVAIVIINTLSLNVNAYGPCDAAFQIYTSGAYRGESVSFPIYLSGGTELAAADLTITYDNNVLECTGISPEWSLSNGGALFIHNYNDSIGEIKIAFTKGSYSLSESYLANINFNVKENAPSGTSNIAITVGSASNDAGQPLVATAYGGDAYIYEQNITPQIGFFDISAHPNETVEMGVYINNFSGKYCGGDIEIEYDKNLLNCVSVNKGDILNSGNILSFININEKLGLIKISFASADITNYNWYLLKINFQPKETATPQQTLIKAKKFTLYDENGKSVATDSDNGYVDILELDKNDVMINLCGAEQELGKTFTTSLTMNSLAKVGAIDIEIEYDEYAFTLMSVKSDKIEDAGGLLSVNSNIDGKIIVSLIKLDGFIGTTQILDLEFYVNEDANVDYNYTMSVNVKKVTDIDLIKLNARSSNGSVYVLNGPDETPIVNIESEALKEYLLSYSYDKNEDGKLSEREMRLITYLSVWSLNIGTLNGLEKAVNLDFLVLNYCNINDVSPLNGLTKLTYLEVVGNQIEDITTLSTLAGLRTLNISDNRITNISSLSGLTKLEGLSASYNVINDITALKSLKDLRTLNIVRNKITDISPLSGLTKLEELSVSNNEINNITPLKSLIELRIFNIGYNKTTDISPLSGLTKLEELSVSNNEINDITALKSLIELRILNIEDNRITNISSLSGLTKLESLNAPRNEINDITALKPLDELRYLNIEDNKVTNISPLSGLTKLDSLSVYNNEINDITALKSLKEMQFLNIGYNKITDISPLGGLTKLYNFSAYNNEINDISSLAGLLLLDSLNLDNNFITDITVLTNLTNLRTCYIVGNYLDLTNQSVKAVINDLIGKGCDLNYSWQNKEVISVKLNITTAKMKLNETLQLVADIFSSSGNYGNISWKTDNPDIASVSDSGLVTALSRGVATISASAGLQEAICKISIDYALSVSIIYDSVKIVNNTVTGELNTIVYSHTNETVLCIIALYDENNYLLGKKLNEATINSGEASINHLIDFTNVKNAKTIKVFYWRDIFTMEPVCTPKVIAIN